MMRIVRVTLLCGGILLLVLAVTAARLGWSNPASVSVGRIVLGAAGFGFLIFAALVRNDRLGSFASLIRPIAGSYVRLSTLVLTTLLLLGLGEGACYVVNQRYTYATDPRSRLPYYQQQAWSGKYWREHARAFGSSQYEPYVVWRTAPFHGETINIDVGGVRETPGAGRSVGSYRVFAFGGSAMLGYGAPDWGTIPAYLQDDMKRRFQSVSVTNFGEKGWVSTQNVILLLRQLQSGNVPNLVIFYDGLNDSLFAYENHSAGGHAGQQRIAMLLEHPLLGALLDSNISKFFLPRLEHFIPHSRQGKTDDRLASAVADEYVANYRAVEALAAQYGFKFEFFLQPIISGGKKALTVDEHGMRSEMDYAAPGFASLLGKVYETMNGRASGLGNLHSLTDVYDDQKSQIWIDWIHVTPEGNKLVADAMAATLR